MRLSGPTGLLGGGGGGGGGGDGASLELTVGGLMIEEGDEEAGDEDEKTQVPDRPLSLSCCPSPLTNLML